MFASLSDTAVGILLPVFGVAWVVFWTRRTASKCTVEQVLSIIRFVNEMLLLIAIPFLSLVSLFLNILTIVRTGDSAGWVFQLVVVPFVLIPAFIYLASRISVAYFHLILNMNLYGRYRSGAKPLNASTSEELGERLRGWRWWHGLLSQRREVGFKTILEHLTETGD